MTWGWRIPFLFALVLAVVALILRRQLEESEEFTTTRALQMEAGGKKPNPVVEAFRHPKNAILGILIGLPQSIAGYVVLTFGLAYIVNAKHVPAQVGFIGTMIVGVLQVFVAPAWGATRTGSADGRCTSSAASASRSSSGRRSCSSAPATCGSSGWA